MAILIKSYPFNVINTTISTPNTINSAELVKYLWVDTSEAINEQYIEITYNGVTKTLLLIDECKYTPVDVCFLNKEGALQTFTFFKSRKDTDTITSENYKGNNEIGLHQENVYNVNAKRKTTLNSGFVMEDKNETIKQLLYSTKVWFLENGIEVPVRVISSNIEYKTRVNDKLLNYTIDFENAFNEINNV